MRTVLLMSLSLVAPLASGASAQGPAGEVELRAYVEPAGTVTDSAPIRLVIEARATEVPAMTVRRFPALTNLEVVSGPSTHQSFATQFVGGQVKQSVTRSLVWTLVAKGPGPAEIPPVPVEFSDKVRMTERIALQVVTGGSGRPDAGTGARSDVDNAPVFLDARLSKDEVWVGEPLLYEVTLYSALTPTNYDPVDEPTLTDFWAERLDVDPTHESYERVIDGRRYRAYPVDRRVLVPTVAGEIELKPLRARIGVQTRARDMFERLLGGRSAEVWRKTAPLRLRVKALPEQGRPEGFDGAVGQFRMDVSLDRDQVTVNDAVALRARVAGHGFLKGVAPPELELSPDLKVFDPEVGERSRPDGARLRSSKTWEWILVPLTPGELTAPRLRFPYFDPVAGEFRVLGNEPGLLTVLRGDRPDEPPLSRGEVRLQHRDITFIKPLRGQLRMSGARLYQRSWFVAALLAPWVVVPLVIAVGRRRARMMSDRGKVRARRARARARKRLRAARRRLDQDGAGFHEEVARAIVDYLADRFDRSGTGLTYDVADDLLAGRDVDSRLRQRVRSCLESCDFARYVPSSEDRASRDRVLGEAEELIQRLERELA